MATDIATRVYNHTFRIDPAIRTLLDTDFYKLLMLQMIWRQHRERRVTFQLINRTTNVRIADVIEERELIDQLDHARSLRFAIGAARGVERQINQRQSLFGHVIGVPGDGPIRHIVNESVLIYECSAHPPNIGVRRLVFIRFAARSFERCGRHPLRWVAVGLQPPVRPKRISTLQARC